MSDNQKGGIFFGAFGVVFLIIGIVLLTTSISFEKKAVKVDATITEIETYRSHNTSGKRKTYHNVYIEYDYNNQHYETTLDEYSNSMHEGAVIEVSIDPANPEKVHASSITIYLSIAAIVLGGIVTAVGTTMVVKG